VLQQIAATYRVSVHDVLTRAHREAYQAAVYLLRRAANEPLRTVAGRFRISPSRISKIQKELEAAPLTPQRARVFDKCTVKN
jgi:chromosomal replication initiation ATPase DnaA